MANLIVDNAKVMSKRQITLPKEIRTQLGIDTGESRKAGTCHRRCYRRACEGS